MKKIGIVGLGDAGFSMHLPATRAMSGVTVAGIADIDAGRLERATKAYGGAGYSDWRDMLNREQLDCVIVATPPDSHAEICIAALEKGANVVCEKPFTDSVAEADRIIAAAAAHSRRIAINHEFRQMPIFQGILKSVAREGSDAIVFAQAWQQVDLPPSGDTGWRGSMRRRVLHEAGVHLIDYILAAFGAVPESVFGAFSSGGGSPGENEDAVVSISLRFPGARLASITMNRLAKGENHYLDARIDTRSASYRASFGGRARITAGLHRAKQPHLRLDYGVSGLAWKEYGSRREVIARNPPDPRMLATRSLLSTTFEAFDKGGELPCSAEWAREVTRVIEAIYRSGESGKIEPVEPNR